MVVGWLHSSVGLLGWTALRPALVVMGSAERTAKGKVFVSSHLSSAAVLGRRAVRRWRQNRAPWKR
jgi:hypothetical protein